MIVNDFSQQSNQLSELVARRGPLLVDRRGMRPLAGLLDVDPADARALVERMDREHSVSVQRTPRYLVLEVRRRCCLPRRPRHPRGPWPPLSRLSGRMRRAGFVLTRSELRAAVLAAAVSCAHTSPAPTDDAGWRVRAAAEAIERELWVGSPIARAAVDALAAEATA